MPQTDSMTPRGVDCARQLLPPGSARVAEATWLPRNDDQNHVRLTVDVRTYRAWRRRHRLPASRTNGRFGWKLDGQALLIWQDQECALVQWDDVLAFEAVPVAMLGVAMPDWRMQR